MNRREFMRVLMQAGVATGAFALESPFRPRLRFAQAAPGKACIIIYQRGGCDGLNTVVPYGDDADYYRLRSTIGIAPPATSTRGVTPPATLMDTTPALELEDLNGAGYPDFFALHPSLGGIHDIYRNGDAAIMPTVQYPDASRSHFDSQYFIESAASSADRMNRDTLDGWLNRHVTTLAQAGDLRAVSLGSSVAQSLRGQSGASAIGELDRFNLALPASEEDALVRRLLALYDEVPSPGHAVQDLVHDVGGTFFSNLEVVNRLDPDYAPDNGAQYPGSAFGRQLQRAAQIFKADVGLEIATVDIGGWDTHSDQGGGNANGRQSRRFRDFADGINALYTDLGGFTADGGLMRDVLICTMTEFGRTAEQNGSFGTDHGTASCWMVFHRGVNGGLFLDGANGSGWPGLAEGDLNRGRYLQWTVDYRDIMAEVLSRFMLNPDLDTVLRGHAYTPVGFLPEVAPA